MLVEFHSSFFLALCSKIDCRGNVTGVILKLDNRNKFQVLFAQDSHGPNGSGLY